MAIWYVILSKNPTTHAVSFRKIVQHTFKLTLHVFFFGNSILGCGLIQIEYRMGNRILYWMQRSIFAFIHRNCM